MPAYDYSCNACGIMELSHSMKDPTLKKCPTCGGKDFHKCFSATPGRVPDAHWQLENSGRGRYFPQLGQKSDNRAYHRDLNSAKEYVSKRGQTFSRD